MSLFSAAYGSLVWSSVQLLLLGKAVIVALMGEELVFPGQRTGQSGLLAMYLAICYSIVGIAVQYYTAETLITGVLHSLVLLRSTACHDRRQLEAYKLAGHHSGCQGKLDQVLYTAHICFPIWCLLTDVLRSMTDVQRQCCSWCAGWQESFRAETSIASEPLLGKPAAMDSAEASDKAASKPKNETETVKALLRMSAVDTPLLMLAFAAGTDAHCNIALAQ